MQAGTTEHLIYLWVIENLSSSKRSATVTIAILKFGVSRQPDQIQMKLLSTSTILSVSSLIRSSSAFTTSLSSAVPSFIRRSVDINNNALNMVRTSGLEVREEGATPIGK